MNLAFSWCDEVLWKAVLRDCRRVEAEREYRSWFPAEYWDTPGDIEYKSWLRYGEDMG